MTNAPLVLLLSVFVGSSVIVLADDTPVEEPKPKPRKAKPRPKPRPSPTPLPTPTPFPADAMIADDSCEPAPGIVCSRAVGEACWSCTDWTGSPECCRQWDWVEPLPQPPAPAPVVTVVRARQGVLYDAQVWGQVAITGDADTAVKPGGRISVDGPIALGTGGNPKLRLLARLDISALPGKTLNLGDVSTFGQDAEAAVGATWRIGRMRIGDQEITTALLGEYGVATMLDGEVLDRYVRWYGGGVRFAESSGGDLTLMYGRHEAGGEWGLGQAMLGFSFPMGFADNAVVLGGSFILSVGSADSGRRQRDVLRVWVGTSIPGLVKAIREKD